MSREIEEHVTPEEMDRAALITQLVCASLNLDYSARALQAKREFSGNAKRRLNLLVSASDAFLYEATKTFDVEDGDSINALSNVMMEVERLLLKCKPSQIRLIMHQLNEFVQQNFEGTDEAGYSDQCTTS